MSSFREHDVLYAKPQGLSIPYFKKTERKFVGFILYFPFLGGQDSGAYEIRKVPRNPGGESGKGQRLDRIDTKVPAIL